MVILERSERRTCLSVTPEPKQVLLLLRSHQDDKRMCRQVLARCRERGILQQAPLTEWSMTDRGWSRKDSSRC